MIKNDDINSILEKGEDEKDTLLKDILRSVQKVETVFEMKKSEADDLKAKSDAAEEDIIKLLNGHIRRLETEKVELSMEVQEARDDLKQLDELKAQIGDLVKELEKSRAETANALHERDDAKSKLSKIQEQWERIIGN